MGARDTAGAQSALNVAVPEFKRLLTPLPRCPALTVLYPWHQWGPGSGFRRLNFAWNVGVEGKPQRGSADVGPQATPHAHTPVPSSGYFAGGARALHQRYEGGWHLQQPRWAARGAGRWCLCRPQPSPALATLQARTVILGLRSPPISSLASKIFCPPK